MKAIAIILGLLGCSTIAGAQDSLRTEPIPSRQQGQYGSPASGKEAGRKEDRVSVPLQELPAAITTQLESNDKFTGWEKGTAFYDRSSDQYLLHVSDGDGTRTFKFDKSGTQISDEAPVEKSGQKN